MSYLINLIDYDVTPCLLSNVATCNNYFILMVGVYSFGFGIVFFFSNIISELL